MNGLLGPVTANRNMLAQAVNSRNKPPLELKQNTPQGLLDAAAMATSPFPIAGDVVGLLADGHRFATQPESRTPLNFGLAALGLLPIIPNMSSAKKAAEGSDLMSKLKGMQPEVKKAESVLDEMIRRQRELEGIQAAMRDPITGQIFTGWSHQQAINKAPQWRPGANSADDKYQIWGRLSGEWDRATDNAGFIDKAGNFISRTQAEKNWGVLTMEDVRDALKKK